MSNKTIPSFANEDNSPSKSRVFGWPWHRFSFYATLFIAIGTVVVFQTIPWFTANPNVKAFALLKEQSDVLSARVTHLETATKNVPAPFIEPKQIEDIETRITKLYQQIDSLHTQEKIKAEPSSSEQTLTLEKEIIYLVHAQQTLKSLFLLARLKAKVLSGTPYLAELIDFKTAVKTSEDLSLLEKYANQGLQVVKGEASKELSSPFPGEVSWLDRLKTMMSSLIKIEKASAPSLLPSSFLQAHQAIEKTLVHLEDVLMQQLTTLSLPLPLAGDTL